MTGGGQRQQLKMSYILIDFQQHYKIFAWSFDDKYIAVGFDKQIQIHDIETAQEVGRSLQGHDSQLIRLHFSMNNSLLASMKYSIIEIWNVPQMLMQRTLEFDKGQLLYDGLMINWQYASTYICDQISIWDIKSESTPRLQLTINIKDADDFQFSKNAKYFLCYNYAREYQHLISIQSGKRTQKRFKDSYPQFLYNSQMVVSIFQKQSKIYNLSNGKLVRSSQLFDHPIWGMDTQLGDKSIICQTNQDELIRSWSVEDGQQLKLPINILGSYISPSGNYILSCLHKQLKVYRIT